MSVKSRSIWGGSGVALGPAGVFVVPSLADFGPKLPESWPSLVGPVLFQSGRDLLDLGGQLCGRTRVNAAVALGPKLVEMPKSNFGRNAGQIGPTLAEGGRSSDASGPGVVEVGRLRPRVDRHRPAHRRFRAKSAGVGRTCHEFQSRPVSVRFWSRPEFGDIDRIWSECGTLNCAQGLCTATCRMGC